MPRASVLVLIPLVLGVGCRPEGPRDDAPLQAATPRPAILATVPRLDRSLVQDTTGSDDAEQLRMLVQLPFDSVLGFYRTRLPAEGWRITADQSPWRGWGVVVAFASIVFLYAYAEVAVYKEAKLAA